VNQSVPDDFHHYYIFSVGKKGLCRYAHEKFGRTDIRLRLKRIFTNQPVEKIVIMGHTYYVMKEYIMNAATL
jgi:hypothetical protein